MFTTLIQLSSRARSSIISSLSSRLVPSLGIDVSATLLESHRTLGAQYCLYSCTTNTLKQQTKWNDVSDPLSIRTKVVCTIGPATDTKERIDQLLENGMNVARLNFSHAGNDYIYPEKCFHLIRNASGIHCSLSNNIHNLRGILVDTKGPEIRTGPLPKDEKKIDIHIGQVVQIHTNQDIVANAIIPKDESTVLKLSVDYMSIARTVSVGSQILLDDGLIELEVTNIDFTNMRLCRSMAHFL
jgi:Pyruvate kinase, barrel domain